MPFELERTLRWLKPQRRMPSLERRTDAVLSFVTGTVHPGPPLLIDSTVYIDLLQDRAPPEVEELIQLRSCHHSSVCLAELTHAFGRLDPRHKGTEMALRALAGVIADIRPHRLTAPDTASWGEAGIVAGLLFRLGGYPKGQGRACLNDTLIYLQARKLGCVLLTANLRDFDLLNQLMPDGRVLFYRPV